MSSKGLGLTLIESKNKVSGIFTDGDLRRLLEKKVNLDDLKINEVMTIDFKFVSEEVLVSEAIKSMEKFKIFSLLVKNSKDQVTGLLRMHDVLEAKII
jgi:arabinose-5-phosphate isomerase